MIKRKIKKQKFEFNRQRSGTKKGNAPVFRFNIFAVMLAFVFLVGNIVIINNITENGYKMKKMKEDLMELKSQKQELSLKISERQSMENIMEKVEDMGLVKAEKIEYIKASASAVVKR
ncbi:MAG: hypothetical protein COU51_01905 [Parcubacteria group bacterium CG10_big_fil_rev_8_21_14_0_10_36_14]|nr:MAG: hypothetical protein COU51_01905 [Parcubacteria group bacterium CG10_big_fil_rev_8_21_14_0_10_36_14]